MTMVWAGAFIDLVSPWWFWPWPRWLRVYLIVISDLLTHVFYLSTLLFDVVPFLNNNLPNCSVINLLV